MIGRRDIFFLCPLCFFPYSRLSSYLLRLFVYLISFLLFPCASVWENTRAWAPHFLWPYWMVPSFFRSVKAMNNWKQSAIKQILLLLLIIVFNKVVIGRRDFFFCTRFTSFYTHASLLTFFICFILFHSCSSHVRVCRKTLVHEFPISCSHTEWYLLYSRNEIFQV